jgi:hemolysin III
MERAMAFMDRVNGTYSRAERLSDAIVHIAGILVALIAAPVLVTLSAVWRHERELVAAAIIYSLGLIAMVFCSALYHMSPQSSWKDVLRRLDQSAIYFKIAATYTPFAVMSGPQSTPFLAGLWAAAIAGVSIKVLTPRKLFGLTVALYLAMGWAAMVFGGPVLDHMTPGGFRLVVIGGTLYTVGVMFLVWERLPFHYTIWHLFVLTASLLLYAAVLVELAGLGDL